MLDLYRKMSTQITNEKRLRWVNTMKTNGVYINTNGDGNCAMYTLALYVASVCKKKPEAIQDLATHYELNETDKWLPDGTNLVVINKPSLVGTEVNRHKFVKMYKTAIDVDVYDAGTDLNRIIQNDKKWDKYKNLFATDTTLRKHTVLLKYMEKTKNPPTHWDDVRIKPCNLDGRTPQETSEIFENKYTELQKKYIEHLRASIKDRCWMEKTFIETVTHEIERYLTFRHGPIFDFRRMFCTSDTDNKYFVSFESNSNKISSFLFVHQPGHWEVITVPILAPDVSDFAWATITGKIEIADATFTQGAEGNLKKAAIVLDDDGTDGDDHPKRRKTDPNDTSDPIELDSGDEGGSAKRPKTKEEIEGEIVLDSSDEDGDGRGGGPAGGGSAKDPNRRKTDPNDTSDPVELDSGDEGGSAKGPNQGSRNTDAMTAAIMLRLRL